MSGAGESFRKLLPMVADESFFCNSVNKKKVQSRLIDFYGSIHQISKSTAIKVTGDDPYVWLSVKDLKDLAKNSLSAFQNGQCELSREMVVSSAATCFHCHTRFPQGMTKSFWSTLDIDAFSLPPGEKANLHIAMRDFDKGLQALKTALTAKDSKAISPEDAEEIVKKYLFIALRGKNSFQLAFQFLHSQRENPNLSKDFKKTMLVWESELLNWQKQEVAFKNGQLPLSAAIDVKTKDFPRQKNSNYVRFLVAATILHRQVQESPQKMEKAKAYLYLGQIYSQWSDFGYWELPELYFETCIHYVKKTPVAQQCFKQYEKFLENSFKTTRGVPIPQYEKSKIRRLRALSGAMADSP